MKTPAMAKVIFKSAVVGRRMATLRSSALMLCQAPTCEESAAKPTEPTPGRSANQFETRMKIKRVASREKTLLTMCGPTISSKVS